MNFELSEHHQMLQAAISRYLSEQYSMSRRINGATSSLGYDPKAWREFGEQGFIGALCPEKLGGFGGSGLDLFVVFQELGRALVVEPFLTSVMVAGALEALDANATQFEGVVSGEGVMGLGLAAPGRGDGTWNTEVTATRADNEWQLRGRQQMVHFGESAERLLIFAAFEGSLGLFQVAKDSPGLEMAGYPVMDGGRAADVEFENVAAECLGQGSAMEALLSRLLAWGRVALCAEALGCMEKACEMTVEYLRDRKQFGRPIGTFQALRHRLVDLLVEVEQSRSLVINAANQLDSHDGDSVGRDQAVAAAKYHVGRTGQWVAEECVQLHGGIGMTWEYPLGHYAKRLVMLDHQLGDSDHHLQAFARKSWG